MKIRYHGTMHEVQPGTLFGELVKERKGGLRPLLARQQGAYYELEAEILREEDVFAVYADDYVGHKTYERTLSFVLVAAFYNLFPERKLTIDHSISRGLYCWVQGHVPSTAEIDALKAEIQRIIDADLPIEKICYSREEVLRKYQSGDQLDKYHLIKEQGNGSLKLYALEKYEEYFYGKMAPSTGVLNLFDIVPYKEGFVIIYPTMYEPEVLRPFYSQDKLFEIFKETALWNELLGVPSAGYLNEKVERGEANTLIQVTEALHEKKLVYIADEIKKRTDVKVVLIAGPSSSGKTSLANRLGVQLRVNGLVPVPVSMDDYFVPRRLTPRKPDGSFDFENLKAIDLDLFDDHVRRILHGEGVELPHFNFISGERESSGRTVILPENGVLIVEGIHGLNPKLLSDLPKSRKFKIYISALTVMNLDRHNRIATTDVRKLRRMARDSASRGYSPEETLTIFPSVSLGEKTWIFPFQEEADAMFNSTLFYEMAVLKKHTLAELEKIGRESPVYEEAKRLVTILKLFRDIEDALVPSNSILREFIGGSTFYNY